MIDDRRTRVLIALLAVYAEDGRATVRSVALEANRSISGTYNDLVELRHAGLVWWDEECAGTLRPLVGAVA